MTHWQIENRNYKNVLM